MTAVEVMTSPFKGQQTQSQVQQNNQKLLSDDLLKEVSGKAIPVDMDEFIDQVSALENHIKMGLSPSASQIGGIRKMANRILQQSKYLEEAEKRATNQDALGEIAVGDRGQLYVAGKNGKISQVNLGEYDPEKHGAALTINELIEQRKFNPTQAFDTSLTQAINNNIGMTKIQSFISDIVKTMGQASSTSEAYTDIASYVGREAARRPTESQLQALQTLYNIGERVGLDSILKVTDEATRSNINEAFNYIYSVLPRNMRYQLTGRYVAEGGNLDKSGNYIQDLILGAITTQSKIIDKQLLDYSSGFNKAAGTDGSKAHEVTMKGLDQLAQGTLGKVDYTIVNKYNPDLALTLHGNGLGQLVNAKDEIVPMSILSDALNTGVGALVEKDNIYFGDQKISPYMLDNFVYNGGEIVNVWAPTKADGSVDFSRLAAYEKVKQLVKQNPNLKKEDISQLLAEEGINGTIDTEGNFVGKDPTMQQFLVVTGLTSDEVINPDDNSYSYILQGNTKDAALQKIKQIYGTANKGNKGDAVRAFPTGWFDFSTDVIAAPIFMKLSRTGQIDAGTITGNGARVPAHTYQQLIQREQAKPIAQPSSSVLL